MNKWILKIADNYIVGDQKVVRTEELAIPPTSGDRTDIIGESGKYYYGMTKAQFMERLTPEEYLNQNLKGLEGDERKKVLDGITWTPRRVEDNIAVIIHIKKGEITLKTK
jgi:hypothetical protein